MTDDKQIKANRENSRKSTGPKNLSKTRFNAIKHGILAKEVVITTGEARENKDEFDFIFKRLIEELSPSDIIQEMLVEKIAVDYWRLRRLIKTEKGYIKSRSDYVTVDTQREIEQKMEVEVMCHYSVSKNMDLRNEIEKNTFKNSLPATDILDVLLRYEISLERSMQKKIELLMSLKKRNGFVSQKSVKKEKVVKNGDGRQSIHEQEGSTSEKPSEYTDLSG